MDRGFTILASLQSDPYTPLSPASPLTPVPSPFPPVIYQKYKKVILFPPLDPPLLPIDLPGSASLHQ